jgi:hypothetical protein
MLIDRSANPGCYTVHRLAAFFVFDLFVCVAQVQELKHVRVTYDANIIFEQHRINRA